MKTLHRHVILATVLATGFAVAIPLTIGPAGAEESATVPTYPGFNPSTGQINPGVVQQAPSNSTDVRKIPTHAEAVAAVMMPVSTQPSAGTVIVSGPQDSGTNASVSAQTASGQQPAATTGAATSEKAGAEPPSTVNSDSSATAAAAAPPPSGPIGSVGETIPAKFSKRNDILDRVPIMAIPLPLAEKDRQRIYQTVMADKTQPAANADALTAASLLSTEQALNETHALPDTLQDIALLKGLHYVKTKDKVLLVVPSIRVVIDEITS